MNKNDQLKIGDLAKATDTKVVTIRYYERIGLMPEPPRTQGGYRLYNAAHLDILNFIRRCRDLGFNLDQVRALLSLSVQKQRDCADVDQVAAEHLTEVEDKIADLTKLAKELRRITRCCKGGRIADCRIIESLSP